MFSLFEKLKNRKALVIAILLAGASDIGVAYLLLKKPSVEERANEVQLRQAEVQFERGLRKEDCWPFTLKSFNATTQECSCEALAD